MDKVNRLAVTGFQFVVTVAGSDSKLQIPKIKLQTNRALDLVLFLRFVFCYLVLPFRILGVEQTGIEPFMRASVLNKIKFDH